MRSKSGPQSPAEQHIREIRRQTRKLYSSEEKIRIVLESLRGEHSIAELCRREGIAQGLYYRWSKEFLEAGKKRLSGDTERQATSGEVKAQVVLQRANIPATVDAEQRLHERGVLCVPGFIANAGGVITAAVEYQGGSQAAALEMTALKVRENNREVLAAAQRDEVLPRNAAHELTLGRVERAMAIRRFK